jgi:hypothetical protein
LLGLDGINFETVILDHPVDPVYFNNPARLRKEFVAIEPFSAFIIFF